MSEQLLPIVVDLETSGLSLVKSGIWQIGAVDLNTMEEFFDEGRIDDEDKVLNEALKIIGKTEEELRDNNKQSQKELLEKFFNWVAERKMKNLICQCPQFDFGWLWRRAEKYSLEAPFHKRAFDLHSIAQTKFYELNNKFSIEEDHCKMGLDEIVEFCGVDNNRGAHNALEDAKLTAECFSRLMFGKSLFEEYAKFEIPEVLRK